MRRDFSASVMRIKYLVHWSRNPKLDQFIEYFIFSKECPIISEGISIFALKPTRRS